MDSGNLVAMKGVNGQPGNWNFFDKDFATHIQNPTSAKLEAVAIFFRPQTTFIGEVALSNLANIFILDVAAATQACLGWSGQCKTIEILDVNSGGNWNVLVNMPTARKFFKAVFD